MWVTIGAWVAWRVWVLFTVKVQFRNDLAPLETHAHYKSHKVEENQQFYLYKKMIKTQV